MEKTGRMEELIQLISKQRLTFHKIKPERQTKWKNEREKKDKTTFKHERKFDLTAFKFAQFG